jgi:hypothetical protein
MELESSTSELDSPKVQQKVVKPSKVKVSSKSKPEVAPSSSSKPEVESGKPGFFDDILNKLKDKNNFIYIVVGVAVLGAVGYYVYVNKFKKPNEQPNGAQPNGAQPNGAQPNGAQPNGAQPNGAQPNGVQPNGAQPNGAQQGKQVPKLPVPKQNAPDPELQMLRRQLMQKQENEKNLLQERMMLIRQLEEERMMAQHSIDMLRSQQGNMSGPPPLPPQQQRKLQHPGPDVESDDDNEINLDDIQADEHPNVSKHNLTNAELEQIQNKLNSSKD